MSKTTSQIPQGRVSLQAVADRAGVSSATVSRVLSNSSHPVAAATRRRVLKASNSLGFRPNQLARALVTAKSQTVGVIVHDISDPYFGELVRGLEDGLSASGYRLFVASSDRDSARELEYARAFDDYQADAIVFAASALEDRAYQRDLNDLVGHFRARGGVIILLSDHFLTGYAVHFDNHAAVSAMVSYLAVKGHERIGFIQGPAALTVSKTRFAAYGETLARLGLPFDPALVASGNFSIQGGMKAALQVLEVGHRPTAILAANDLMAIGAIRALLDAGIRVPEDISIAGFDDMPLAAFAPVPLTTMRVPVYDIGRRGAEMLARVLEGEDPEDTWIGGELIERGSVASPVRPS
jgi:LacI family transcriptional regulator